jgi:hypothetical protein
LAGGDDGRSAVVVIFAVVGADEDLVRRPVCADQLHVRRQARAGAAAQDDGQYMLHALISRLRWK